MNKPANLEKRYLYVLKRWWWLLVLMPVLASGFAYYYLFKDQTTLYEAQSQLLIGPGIDSPDPDVNSLRASAQLMQMYKKLATTDSFLQSIIDDLKLGQHISMGTLRGMIDISADTNSLLLTITVQSEDRDLAVDVANAVANNLFGLSPKNPNSAVSILREQNRAQATKLYGTIQQEQATITTLENQLQRFNEQNPAETYDVYKNLDSSDNWINVLEAKYQESDSVAQESQVSIQIFQELVKFTLTRIAQLQAILAETDPNLQNYALVQISAEKDHLSELQQAASTNQQLVEGQTLPDFLQAIETNITNLEEKINTTVAYDVNTKKFLNDQLAQERTRLADGEKIVAVREQLILSQLANERKRLSEIRMVPVQEKQFLVDQIISERSRLSTMQQTYTNLNDVVYRVWTNQVMVAQIASKPSTVPSNLKLNTLVASVAGLALALAFILAIGYFDTSIQTAVDIETSIGIPALGMIRKKIPFLSSDLPKAERLVARTLPGSQAAQDYRILAMKLSSLRWSGISSIAMKEINSENTFLASSKTQTVLISGLYTEGYASEVAANLAIALSQSGMHVLLVDANLHRPTISTMFEIDGQQGFSTTLMEPLAPVEFQTVPSLDNLTILPSGPTPDDAFKLLGSSDIPKMMNGFKEQADIVLFVGSPLQSFADSLILASHSDRLILVVPDQKLRENLIENFVKNQETYKWEIIGAITVKKERDYFYGLRKLFVQSKDKNQSVRLDDKSQPSVKGDGSLRQPNNVQ